MLYLTVGHPKHTEYEETLVSKMTPQNDARARSVYSQCRKLASITELSDIMREQLRASAL